jgi:hypothetical protein
MERSALARISASGVRDQPVCSPQLHYLVHCALDTRPCLHLCEYQA